MAFFIAESSMHEAAVLKLSVSSFRFMSVEILKVLGFSGGPLFCNRPSEVALIKSDLKSLKSSFCSIFSVTY